MFPTEILENIFSQLPLTDLVSKALVCKHWYEVISREKFLIWKKNYSKYRLGNDTSKEFVSEICRTNGINTISDCFPGLVRFMANWKVDGKGSSFPTFLSKHCKYNLAVEVVKERFPDLAVEDIPPWALVAVICCISNNVAEIYSLFNILIHPKSNTTAMEVIEPLYCICTFLLYFCRTFKAPSRCHYNVYYALQLYENCWHLPDIPKNVTPTSSPQKLLEASNNLHLTYEQIRVIQHPIQQNDMIKVVAFAGTGKTTTLVQLVQNRPEMKFLFIVFNKSVQLHTEKIFQDLGARNVECRTAHSLAYRNFGAKYREKLRWPLSPGGIKESRLLKWRQNSGELYRRATLVNKTITSFLGSRDSIITIDHVPLTFQREIDPGELSFDILGVSSLEPENLSENERKALAGDAEDIWKAMCSITNKLLPMSHDGYLKLWQLSQPNLVREYGVDCILLDEGQDLSGAMLDVFLRQQCARIIVGDPHQQIYQFRGAINAMQSVNATHTFYLTQSFRFGPEIGFMANSCLEVFKKVKNQFLIGCKMADEVGSDLKMGELGQVGFIGRTKLGLFKKAVELLCLGETSNSPRKLQVAFAGGWPSYEFEKLIDAWYLKNKEIGRVKNKGMQKWCAEGYDQMKKYASMADPELHSTLMTMEWSGKDTERYVNTIKLHITNSMDHADVTFSTAHKSKGLEWNTVVLLDDFLPDFFSSTRPLNELDAAEPNLLYVAATRARRKLILNSACFYTLMHVSDKRERLVPTEEYLNESPAACCPQCSKAVQLESGKAVSVQLSRLHVEKGTIYEDGLLCSVCAAVPFHPVVVLESYQNRGLPRFKDDHYHMFFKEIVGPRGDELVAAQLLYDNAYKEQLGVYFRACRFKSLVEKSVPLNELTDSDDEDYFAEIEGLDNIYNQEVRDV